jgi:hypothetical protein
MMVMIKAIIIIKILTPDSYVRAASHTGSLISFLYILFLYNVYGNSEMDCSITHTFFFLGKETEASSG